MAWVLLIVFTDLDGGYHSELSRSGAITNCIVGLLTKTSPRPQRKGKKRFKHSSEMRRNRYELCSQGTHINGDRKLFCHQATETYVNGSTLYVLCPKHSRGGGSLEIRALNTCQLCRLPTQGQGDRLSVYVAEVCILGRQAEAARLPSSVLR